MQHPARRGLGGLLDNLSGHRAAILAAVYLVSSLAASIVGLFTGRLGPELWAGALLAVAGGTATIWALNTGADALLARASRPARPVRVEAEVAEVEGSPVEVHS